MNNEYRRFSKYAYVSCEFDRLSTNSRSLVMQTARQRPRVFSIPLVDGKGYTVLVLAFFDSSSAWDRGLLSIGGGTTRADGRCAPARDERST